MTVTELLAILIVIMSNLIALMPSDMAACDLFSFLSIDDLGCLDVAVTNHLLRQQLFQIYQSLCISRCDRRMTPTLLAWFLSRSITLLTATLSKDLDTQGLRSICHQLVINPGRAAKMRHLDISPCNAAIKSSYLNRLITCCSGLESVNLSLCKEVTKAALTQLGRQCRNLQSLDLSVTRVTDKALVSLAENCSTLVRLNLRACSLITDEAIIAISQFSPSLTFVDISLTGARVTDAAVIALTLNCPSLVELNASSCNITDAAVTAVAQNCLEMESIDLSYCCQITDSGVLDLVERRSTMRTLSLKGNSNITDLSVTAVAQSCLLLEQMELSFCQGVTEAACEIVFDTCLSRRQNIPHKKFSNPWCYI